MFTGSYEAATALTKTNVRLNAKVTNGEASITISGPADKWFSVAFGTPNFAMADKPWTLVVDGRSGPFSDIDLNLSLSSQRQCRGEKAGRPRPRAGVVLQREGDLQHSG